MYSNSRLYEVDEIYLTGVDCNYRGDKQHSDMFYKSLKKEEEISLIKAGDDMMKQFEALASILKKEMFMYIMQPEEEVLRLFSVLI